MLSGKLDKSINSILLIAKTCIQISIFLGVLITITYCGTIDFYPSGLTIGDTFFFVASSLAFAITYTLFVFALICSGITISPILRQFQKIVISVIHLTQRLRGKKNKVYKINFRHLDTGDSVIALVGIIFFILSVTVILKDFNRGFNFILAILAVGFFVGLWNTKPRQKIFDEKKAKKIKTSFAFIIYIFPLLILQENGSFLNQSMNMIGVRTESVTIQLSKKYTDFLTLNNIKFTKKRSGEGLYPNSTVLFRGIGNNILVSIKGFELSVDPKNIIIGKQN
jgi:hypothetical protein